MLNVTPEARTELHGMLMRALADRPEEGEGSLGFRLVTGEAEGASSQLGLALDAPRPGDEVLEHDGCSVLIVDDRTASLLGDLTLDVVQTAEGTRLGIRS
jgi:Fe-S cluster assembly iron-binding protein IscA